MRWKRKMPFVVIGLWLLAGCAANQESAMPSSPAIPSAPAAVSLLSEDAAPAEERQAELEQGGSPLPGEEAMSSPLEESAQAAYALFLSGDISLLEDAQVGREWTDVQLPGGELEYATLDLDGDGASELLIQRIGNPGGYNAVFHYDGEKLVCWNYDAVETSCQDYPLWDGTMVRQYDFSGSRSYTLFRYQSDGEQEELSRLFAREELVYDDGSTPCPFYTIDGEEIDETAFATYLEEHITKQLPEPSI